ncbi:MAG: UvrD-helicase domain-containing protein [Bacteroidota bacterium]
MNNAAAKLTIYRSSAGAGKTHTLVLAYLRIALAYPDKFTQILAVTFTNQATQEMKQRILVYLYDLAQGNPHPITEVLLQEKGWHSSFLQARAQAVLSNILHQYARFSVSTIDSFFQKIVRGFAHELGLQSSFRIELDQDYVLATIIDDLIIAADQNAQLQRWLVAFAEEKLLSGKSWNLQQELMVLGGELFDESFREHEAQLVQAISQPGALTHFLKALHWRIHHFEQHMQGLGQQALDAIRQAGLAIDDFLYGQAGVMGYLAGLATKRKWTPSQRALRALDSVEAWYKRASDNKEHLTQVVKGALQPCLQDAVRFYNAHYRTYYTAIEVRHFIYAFGIVTQLLEKLNDYRSQHNIMLVSDTVLMLRKIIADNDTPFVYEKIGAFYSHFLIDEFQDISRFQWHNLKPLIANSLNEGHASLVVGDVKQSIYRWRGGDWGLLLTQLEQTLTPTNTVVLDKNWRSKQHIVDFNNYFFTSTAAMLVKYLTDTLASSTDPALQEALLAQVHQLGAVYQDVCQKLPAQRVQANKGYVNITFLEDAADEAVAQDWREVAKARLSLLIEALQKDGFALKDIAVLVRSNVEGREVFNTLLSHQQSPKAQPGCRYDVVSRESLYLSHNPWINILINALYCLSDAENTLAQTELNYLYQVYVQRVAPDAVHTCLLTPADITDLPQAFVAQRSYLQQLPLYALVEALIDLLQLRHAESVAFLQAFQDIVLAFMRKDEVDIVCFLAWWEEQGCRHTLPRAAAQDAITLMTIHQAKGLQFKVVIVPFCAWELDHGARQSPTLWCTADAPPFDSFSVLPVRYSSRLKDTFYVRAYHEEQIQAYLDHLNLLYVAFTRPQDRLYVFAQHPPKTGLKTTADLLYQTFVSTQEATDMPNTWQHAWDMAAGKFEMGAAPTVSASAD